MEKRINAVFWAPRYRQLSSSDLGTSCETEAEAFAELYNRIASEENPIQYINNIYDNAEVELRTDNMEEVTVRDRYAIQMVYEKQDAHGAPDLTLYPAGQDPRPVGMLYVKKPVLGSEPAFEEYLSRLAQST